MIAAILMLVASGKLPVQEKLDQIDRTFVCPESLPSDEARLAAMSLFVAQVQAVEQNLTIRKLVEYRETLLVKHQCTKTLENERKTFAPKQ